MAVSIAAQAALLGGALLLGAAVGVLYDAFRILRVRLPSPLLGGVLDLLFWLAVTVGLFVYAVWAGNGEVRIYMVLSVLGGAVGYFLLFSRGILKLGYLLADLAALLWGIVTLPLRVGARLCKKIGKTQKKVVHYRCKG